MRRKGYTSKLVCLSCLGSSSSSSVLCSYISAHSKVSLSTSVRESSTSATEDRCLSIRETGSSHTKLASSSFADDGGLFPFFKGSGWREPSRRYRRQLEQRFGPLWRYHALALADKSLASLTNTAAGGTTPTTSTTSFASHSAPSEIRDTQREGDANPKDDKGADAQVSEKAKTEPLHHSSLSSSRVASSPPRASAPTDEKGRPHSFGKKSDDTAAVEYAQNETSEDPLLQFLRDNEEEGVVILSMLTSLQRCCHYGSEISEALSLRVRYFFHSLIHRHAIAAAWSLYERLVQMGITLRHNDLVLLLTSLPYETNASEERIKQYIQEAEKAESDRRDKRRRELLWREEEEKTRGKRQRTPLRHDAANALPPKEGVPAEKTANKQAFSVATSAISDPATATSDEVAASVFASQPEWVRRWAMYEASMGNLDFSETRPATTSSTKATNTATTTTTTTAPAVVDRAESKNAFRERITEWDSHDPEINKTSKVTISLMELEAVVEHLYVMQSYSTGAALKNVLAPFTPHAKENKTKSLRARRPSVSSSTINGTNYAREALRIVRRFVKVQHVKGGGGATAVLSPSLVDKLHSLIRVSSSFKLTSQYLTFLTSEAATFATERDALIYLLHLSEQKQTTLKPHEERFFDETVLPLFTVGSASSYVARAWWAAYLCHIKASRPDDFMELLVSARERFGLDITDSHPTDRAASSPAEDHLQLLDVIREAIQSVGEATARLSGEIQSALEEEKLRRAMTTEGLAGGVRGTAEESGLPEALQDTFLCLCRTIVQVCALASAAVVRTDPQSLATLYTFIERVVYGPQGIWVIFQRTYTLGSGDGRPAALDDAPERATMCCAVARCVLSVAQELCFNGSIHHASNTTNPIKLLLELGLGALEEISSQGSQLSSVTVRALVEIRCTLLLLIRRLYTFLDLTPRNQRVLFGAIRSESVDCLVLYAKLLHRIEVTLHSEAIHRLLLSTASVVERKTVMESATPKTREILRLCFVPGNALSSQIGGLLSKREREWLLAYMRRQTRTAAMRTSDSDRSRSRRRFDTIPLERRVALHERVYHIALQDRSTWEKELLTFSDALSGEECLFLLHLLMKNVCIADGVLTTRFFVIILQKVSAERAPRNTAGKQEAAAAAVGATSKNVTWMDAVGVFWSAVDHTRSRAKLSDPRRHERDVLDKLLCPLLQVANQIHQRDVGRQWRKTWARKFTHAEKQDSRFLSLNAQALALLGDDSALDRSIHLVQSSEKAVGSTTRTAAAPTAPPTDEAAAAPEDLLLRVAGQHRSWQAALEAVFKVYGEFAEHEEAVNPYKPAVARTLLSVLKKSRTNLSNTGLRIQAIQHDLWDIQSAVLLMELLLRARRWQKALQVFEDTHKCPEFRHVNHHMSSHTSASQSTKLEAKDVLLYAELHMLALQACAIGGDAEKAATLFAHLKRVLAYFDHTGAEDVARSTSFAEGNEVSLDDVDELELIFDSARLGSDVEDTKSKSVQHVGRQGEEADSKDTAEAPELRQLRDIVMRARRLFLRATTKKMMKTPFSRSEMRD